MREAIEKGIEYESPEIKPSTLISLECPRCHNLCPATSDYCSMCWMPLKRKVADKEALMLEFLRSEVYADERKYAESEGAFLDIDSLSESYHEFVKDSKPKKVKK